MSKEYLFWREVRKTVREECVIEADSLEEATLFFIRRKQLDEETFHKLFFVELDD